ncbi:nitroreductase family protein [uncultured Pelagimonas sp.]|uniref:nitroreductase family protein n=1 Tax=uncultured Pelagimonas sp. TaxID=1618102 RepID=UPI0026112DCA|nr:nitroreductase family protein [uncultured Pelagimonas sp.]
MSQNPVKARLRRVKALVHIAQDHFYDARRYFVHSQSGRHDLTPAQLQGRLLQKAHSIEKGLSMPQRRDFFGEPALRQLEQLIDMYERQGLPEDHISIRKARGAIRAYFEAHAGLEIPAKIKRFEVLSSAKDTPEAAEIGTVTLTRAAQNAAAKGDLESVMRSRRSSRVFAPGAVNPEAIAKAIELAGTTPSVCNRQSNRVYVVRDAKRKAEMLKLQGGSRGFGEDIDTLLVVAADLSNFRDSRERNQGFVDGGMFAMSLLLALHQQGLATCPLNWSAGRKQNQKLLELLGLPPTDLIIMMIGTGQMPESFKVAASPRRGLDDLMIELAP